MQGLRVFFLNTSSSPTTSLFSNYVDPSRRPASLLASAVVHAAVIGVVFYGILNAPAKTGIVTDRFSVRHLDLRTPEQQSAALDRSAAAVQLVTKALRAAASPPPAALQQAIHAAAGPQTLLQPDLPVHTASPEEIPVPRVMIWTPRKEITKNIVAPQPSPPTAAETEPSLDAPNAEINLSDLDLAASPQPSQKAPILPGSTTPVVTHVQSQVQLAPSTTSQQTEQPTPTAVLSISDLQLKDGSVTLPPMNETVRSNKPGSLTGSTGTSPDKQGNADGNSHGNGNGAVGARAVGTAPAVTPNGTAASTRQGAASDNGIGEQASTTRITWPRDGRFSAVVVGETEADQFPEINGVWSGRMAYTVYLHVGLARSWILQYSLPRDDDASAAGNANRLDAPWPYTIVRPNLNPGDVNADALLVHGFVDKSGHFQNLSIVFPQFCPQAPFVLKSLEQWQFRPASQNGQVARVEVLLIIPEELE